MGEKLNAYGLPENEVIKNKGFYISYIPRGGTGGFAPDAGGDETAIVKDGKYYILKGDWRNYYMHRSFDECMAIFYKSQAFKSSWSD